MASWKALHKRYGASSTTLPVWLRLALTAPFALVLATCVMTLIATGNSVSSAFSIVLVVGAGYAFWAVVPHFWVRSDRSVRDERLEQAVGRQLRQELALREVREPGSDYDAAPASLWHRRPAAPSRW